LILELGRAEIAEGGVETSRVVGVFDEPGKVLGDVVEGFERHRIDGPDLESFMKLSALALS
jgi:hypothetical protein